MRIVAGLMCIVAGGAYSAPAFPQERPDYSGAWTSAPAPQTRASQGARRGSLGSGWGLDFMITQTGEALTIERAFFTRGDIQPSLRFHYSLDGTETTNTVHMGRGFQDQASTAAWEGNNLVITSVYTFVNPEDGRVMASEVRHVLSLQASRLPAWPPSLVVETTRGGELGGHPSTTRTVYRRN